MRWWMTTAVRGPRFDHTRCRSVGNSSFTACDSGKEGDKAKQAAAATPSSVVVTEVVQKTVPIYSEFVARRRA